MKFSQVLFIVAIIILIAWVAGLVFKFTAWVMNGLVGLAAIIVIIGIISLFIKSKQRSSSNDDE